MVLPSVRHRNGSSKLSPKGQLLLLGIAILSLILVLLYHNADTDQERVLLSVSKWNMHPHHRLRQIFMTIKYAKPSRNFERNRFTIDDFVVNGVNLAQYGMEQGTSSGEPHKPPQSHPCASI